MINPNTIHFMPNGAENTNQDGISNPRSANTNAYDNTSIHTQHDLSSCAQIPHALSDNIVPKIVNLLTTTPAEVDAGEKDEAFFPVINLTPSMLDLSTSMLSEAESGENSALSLTNCNDSCEESILTVDRDLDSTFRLQKYLFENLVD